MKLSTKLIAGAIAITGITILSIAGIASPKQSGIKRTDLQRHDLSAPGREMIQAIVELAPGAAFDMHKHPGEEIIYVTEGALEYEVEGKGVVRLKAGDVLFVPAGTFHSARNNGEVSGAELATYVVEKGKPLIEFKK